MFIFHNSQILILFNFFQKNEINSNFNSYKSFNISKSLKILSRSFFKILLLLKHIYNISISCVYLALAND